MLSGRCAPWYCACPSLFPVWVDSALMRGSLWGRHPSRILTRSVLLSPRVGSAPNSALQKDTWAKVGGKIWSWPAQPQCPWRKLPVLVLWFLLSSWVTVALSLPHLLLWAAHPAGVGGGQPPSRVAGPGWINTARSLEVRTGGCSQVKVWVSLGDAREAHLTPVVAAQVPAATGRWPVWVCPALGCWVAWVGYLQGCHLLRAGELCSLLPALTASSASTAGPHPWRPLTVAMGSKCCPLQ